VDLACQSFVGLAAIFLNLRAQDYGISAESID
jgi:hypothetical protein